MFFLLRIFRKIGFKPFQSGKSPAMAQIKSIGFWHTKMGYLSFGRSYKNCARLYHIPYISDHLSNIWRICWKSAKIKKMCWMKDTELFLVLRYQLYTSDSFLQNMPQIWFSWQMIWPEQSCRMSNNLQLKWPIFRHLSTFFMIIVDVQYEHFHFQIPFCRSRWDGSGFSCL